MSRKAKHSKPMKKQRTHRADYDRVMNKMDQVVRQHRPNDPPQVANRPSKGNR